MAHAVGVVMIVLNLSGGIAVVPMADMAACRTAVEAFDNSLAWKAKCVEGAQTSVLQEDFK